MVHSHVTCVWCDNAALRRWLEELEAPRANCPFSGSWRYWQLPSPRPGGCHRPSRPTGANCSGLFMARDRRPAAKRRLAASAGQARAVSRRAGSV